MNKKTTSHPTAALCLAAVVALVGCATTSPVAKEKSSEPYVQRDPVYMQGWAPVVAQAGRCQKDAKVGANGDWKPVAQNAAACTGSADWVAVEASARELMAHDIACPWGAYYMSLSALAQNKPTRALWMLELAEKKAGAPAALFSYQHGRILWELGDHKGAVVQMQIAEGLDAGFVEAHRFLGEVYYADLDFRRADEEFVKVAALEPSQIETWEKILNCRLARKDDEGAKAAREQIAAIHAGTKVRGHGLVIPQATAQHDEEE